MKKITKTGKTVYKHLQPHERDEIAHLLSQNYTQKKIAEKLKRNPSTISREIKRNGTQIRE
ncbi:MAG TPA: helix-turn-helix domain-containing protein, partial [Spirochaetota bacterium]|nr:helix-turn-helix domain-containing protein [Spirochaetota bacterium]